MLHQGRVLSQGAPQEVAALATGRSFIAVPPAGQSARNLQARLLDQPDIVDAVPDGGRVRFVRRNADERGEAAGRLAACCMTSKSPRCRSPVRGRLHDAAARDNPPSSVAKPSTVAHPLHPRDEEPVVRVRQLVKKFGAFTAVRRHRFRSAPR